MPAPAFTLAAIARLDPCASAFAAARQALPKRRRITAAQAREAGVSFDDIVWVISAVARTDKDVERRLRLWLSDCAARVLHIYEKTETSDTPRKAIIAARLYARGEIGAAARDVAGDAAWAAARDAARAAAWDVAGDAARDAAWAAARAAAGAAAWDAAGAAAWDAAGDAAGAAAWDAAEAWQFDRLILWLSDEEPADWTLPVRKAKAA